MCNICANQYCWLVFVA